VILADGAKVVDVCYPVPKAAYQPIATNWTLTSPGTGGGGNPQECQACQISQVEARWVVGIDPTALRVKAGDAQAVSEAVAAELKPLLAEGGRVVRYSPSGRFAVVSGLDQARARAVKGRPSIRYVEPDLPVRSMDVGGPRLQPVFRTAGAKATVKLNTDPNDPQFADQRYLPDIGAPAAWAAGHKSTSVSVAIVDTGAAYELADLTGHVTKGQDFACKHADQVCDGNGHGTHVSGTILANTNNGTGVAGVAWDGKLLVIKALDDNGRGHFSDICDGVRFAVDQGAKVVSLSIGALIPKDQVPTLLVETAQYALDKEVVLVCAAGNDGNDNDGDVRNYPSSLEFPNVIGVLATNTGARTKASFSDYGVNHVHIAAPGTDVLNLWPDGSFRYLSGTSMATPQVSAALAIYWNDLGGGLNVQQRLTKFLDTYSLPVPALNPYCKNGRFLQMK
jgi:thermitase